MTRLRLLAALVFTLLATPLGSSAHAHDVIAQTVDRAPSLFSYAGQGFLIGTFSGFAGGYLVARPEGIQGEDWRTLVFGTGIGALSGSAVGFALGIFDAVDGLPDTAAISLRDMMYGTGFGALAGTTVGGLVALRTADAEHLAFGAAIGTLSGAALGLAVGLFQGPREGRRRRPVARPSEAKPSRPIIILGSTHDARGALVWTPALAGTF